MKTELVLAIRRQIRNLREMIAAAEREHRSQRYLDNLRKKLRSAERRLFR